MRLRKRVCEIIEVNFSSRRGECHIYYVKYSKQINLVLQRRLCRTETEPCCQKVPECSVLIITNTNMFCQTSKTLMLFSPLILEFPVLQETTKPQLIYWVGIFVDFGENGQNISCSAQRK